MKTHYNIFPYNSTYDPYLEDYPEKYICGSHTPERNIDETSDLKYVNCKKCLKLIERNERSTTAGSN